MSEKLSALILYRDKSFKIVNCNKLNVMNLNDPDIKIIFIPNTEIPNGYIPIKPSVHYKFSKAVVDIVYQGFVASAYEDLSISLAEIDEDFVPKEYHQVCYNMVEFINAIYNLWKFRGTSMFISENANPDSYGAYDSWIIYPLYYQIKFYDRNGNVKDVIDSGEMKSIPEKYYDKAYEETTIEHCQEEYMESLGEIFFTPLCKNFLPYDAGYYGLLPNMICLDESTWMEVKKPGQSLSPFDYVLIKIGDFGSYYYTQYGMYESLFKIRFTLQIYGWCCLARETNNYLKSLDKLKVPKLSDKLDAIQSLEINETTPTIDILSDINSPLKILEVMMYLRNMASFVHYILYDIFGEPNQEDIQAYPEDGCRLRVLAIFNPEKQAANTSNRILTELELSDEKIQDAILSFLKEDN